VAVSAISLFKYGLTTAFEQVASRITCASLQEVKILDQNRKNGIALGGIV
jgi:hypothetical protein